MALHQLRGNQGYPRVAHEGPQRFSFIGPASLTRGLFPATSFQFRRSPDVQPGVQRPSHDLLFGIGKLSMVFPQP